jgi:asparagine synthase (glutamine-hydrolysing)
MCGIVGVLGPAAGGVIDPMVDALRHRGPDGRGVFRERGVALGATRLAIVAPRDGTQPMIDGPLVLVANAEIYNHAALRSELKRRGAEFATACDIEVILHGYRAWGLEVVERLRGFFAFALWDAERGELVVARDRFGIAPLVTWRGPQLFCAASEVKALSAVPEFSARMNPRALDHYLDQRHVGARRSLFEGVEPVPPGARGVFDRQGRGRFVRWAPVPVSGRGGAPAGGLAEAAQQLERALDQATATRLSHGEAPVGLYLSGGLDSSVIASAAGRSGAKPAAFSHGFDPREDELAYAEEASALSGGPWHPVQLGPDDLDALPAIIRAMEEPVANSDLIGLWALAREASKHVKVVLCGEGSDELFGSYPHQQLLDRAAQSPRWARTAAWLVRHTPRALTGSLGPYPGAMSDPSARARLSAALTGPNLDARLAAVTSLFDADARQSLYTPAFAEQLAHSPPAGLEVDIPAPTRQFQAARIADRLHTLDTLITRDLLDWLPSYHLGRENRIAMAWGVEARYPFLDDAVVDAVLPLPREFKVGPPSPTDKRLLRRVAARHLPKSLAGRPKGPVRVPLSLFGPRWPELARDLLSPDRLARRGLFRPDAVAALLAQSQTSPFVAGRQVFALVLLELWFDAFGAGVA